MAFVEKVLSRAQRNNDKARDARTLALASLQRKYDNEETEREAKAEIARERAARKQRRNSADASRSSSRRKKASGEARRRKMMEAFRSKATLQEKVESNVGEYEHDGDDGVEDDLEDASNGFDFFPRFVDARTHRELDLRLTPGTCTPRELYCQNGTPSSLS